MAFKIGILGPKDAMGKAQAGFREWERRKDAGERKAALEAREGQDAKPAEGMNDAKLNPEEAKRRMDSELIDAVEAGDKARALELLDSGADADAKDGRNVTVLALAADAEIARMLIRRGADVNAKDDSGLTPLMWAARKGRTEIAGILMDNGAGVEASEDPRIRAELLARDNRRSRAECITFAERYFMSPLMLAAEEGMTETAMMLIGRGANVNAITWTGLTPLMWAAGGGHMETVEMLVENGAKVAAIDSKGYTATARARHEGKHETAREMFKRYGV
jgi:ankyrin repeat protein